MFYTFRQNNSFGKLIKSKKKGIAKYVVIETKKKSQKEANKKAEQIGIYFNGVKKSKDCPCCGDRWERVKYNEATVITNIEGKTLDEYLVSDRCNKAKSICIHFLNGTINQW